MNLLYACTGCWQHESTHSRNELKGHSQTVADMNFQMHKTTEASFPSSLITTSDFDSICVIKVIRKKLAINDDYALSTRTTTSHSEEA